MGNDHIPLGYQDAASGIQFQILDKGQVVQGCPRDITAVDFNRIEQSHRRDLSAAACLPLNAAESGIISVILKFESDTVIIVVSGPAKRC